MCALQLARSKSDAIRSVKDLLLFLWTSRTGRKGAAKISAAFCNVQCNMDLRALRQQYLYSVTRTLQAVRYLRT